jgi:hypothetical protein
METDFIVNGSGSIYIVAPQSERAAMMLKHHVGNEATWLGDSLAVEHRYVRTLVEGMKRKGFTFLFE